MTTKPPKKKPGSNISGLVFKTEEDYQTGKSRFSDADRERLKEVIPDEETVNAEAENLKPFVIDDDIAEELSSMKVYDIPLSKIYSAPKAWNKWPKMSESKILETAESFIKIGQQTPCVLWKVDKEEVRKFYGDDDEFKNDPYSFEGHEYMVLSGHNRSSIRKMISELEDYSNDPYFKVTPAVIYFDKYSNEFYEKILDIINDSNYLARENTTKEIMYAIQQKYRKFTNNDSRKSKSGEIAKKIAQTLNMTDRSVYRYTKLNADLIDEILNLMYDNKISMNNCLFLSDLEKDIQYKLYNKYSEVLKDKKKISQILKQITVDMNWDEIEPYFASPESQIKYQKISVTIPENHVSEFYELVRNWKKQILQETSPEPLQITEVVKNQ